MKKSVVLVVDDDKDLSEFIVNSLSRSGFQCVVAMQVEDALPLIGDKKLAIAIVDIFMPGIGGIEGIRRIKQLNSECRVLAISGGFRRMNGADALRAAHIVGADAVLAKPFRQTELRALIDELLVEVRESKSA